MHAYAARERKNACVYGIFIAIFNKIYLLVYQTLCYCCYSLTHRVQYSDDPENFSGRDIGREVTVERVVRIYPIPSRLGAWGARWAPPVGPQRIFGRFIRYVVRFYACLAHIESWLSVIITPKIQENITVLSRCMLAFLIGAEMEIGHLSWHMTHVTHHTVDPWPMTIWPLYHFTLRMGLGGEVVLSVLRAKKIVD